MSLIIHRLGLLILCLFHNHIMASTQAQTSFHETQDQSQWKLTLSKNWDVLGPFPIHAREQQYLSPSFPIDCEPIPLSHPRFQPTTSSAAAYRL